MANKREPMVSVRLPQTTLTRISTEISLAKSGALKANPTVSEFIRSAIEEKLQRMAGNRRRANKEFVECELCKKRIARADVGAEYEDLFRVRLFRCIRCEHKND